MGGLIVEYDKKQFWIARQEWEDVLFIHIPVPFEHLQKYVPRPLELEAYQNQAWMSFVILRSKNSQLRGIPITYPSFYQLNIRTYVNCNGNQGVYFLSIDANTLPVVLGVKSLSIPQHFADMNMRYKNDNIYFSSTRIHSEDQLFIKYRPLLNNIDTEHQSLTKWLTERYFMWFIKGDKIIRGIVSHDPWVMKEAKLDIFKLKGFLPLLSEVGVEKPFIHYAERKQAYIHPFKIDGIYQAK